MDYEKAIEFQGDAGQALGLARSALVNCGFQVSTIEDGAFSARSSKMPSTREHPLFGASQVVVAVRDGRLALGADLGGLRKLRLFLIWFIGGMELLFVVAFGIFLFPKVQSGDAPWFILLVPLAPFAPWPFLIPVMSRKMRARTIQALDTLLENARTVGEGA